MDALVELGSGYDKNARFILKESADCVGRDTPASGQFVDGVMLLMKLI
jgi:hypothetical protein